MLLVCMEHFQTNQYNYNKSKANLHQQSSNNQKKRNQTGNRTNKMQIISRKF